MRQCHRTEQKHTNNIRGASIYEGCLSKFRLRQQAPGREQTEKCTLTIIIQSNDFF